MSNVNKSYIARDQVPQWGKKAKKKQKKNTALNRENT